MNFTWTKAAPTSVGWYWVRIPIGSLPGKAMTKIASVWSITDRNGYTSFRSGEARMGEDIDVSEMDWEWAGPIPAPTEAAP